MRQRLLSIYRRLYQQLGPQGWWPGRSRFEVIVGAILTQNTNWGNVEKAIRRLRQERMLSPSAMSALSRRRLAALIRPAGTFAVKAGRLHNFLTFLRERYRGSLRRMFREEPERIRGALLQVSGIGPETADSILLYAANMPFFVVDAYTKRIFSRHRLISRDASYHEVQAVFMNHLPRDAHLYNEYHALLVAVGKAYCRSTPRCDTCPLRWDLEHHGIPLPEGAVQS
ncbi:MAG: endonuclease III domain-containing protein [Candidatus Methylomirabilales bacterium]